MFASLLALVWPWALVCVGCGHVAPPRPATATFDTEKAAARLCLPPDDLTRITRETLETEARSGNSAARAVWALYLLDLFDYARFAQDPGSRKFLFQALEGSYAAPSGEIATEWVAERLDAELAKIIVAGPEVRTARTLLALERARTREEAAARLATVRAVARNPGAPLRANAILRLYGYCARALRDATQAPRPERALVANQCLYALYDSDPSAYFEEDPEARPPDPPWTAYRDGLESLLRELASTRSRLAPLAEKLRAQDTRFFAEIAPARLPPALDIAALGLPVAEAAPAWDRTPVVKVGRDGVSLGGPPIADEGRLTRELASLVRQDPRRTIAVLMEARAPAHWLLKVAGPAHAAGAWRLELGVAQPIALKVPATDYWAGKKVMRLGAIPISLKPLDERRSLNRERPRAGEWDPSRDELGLVLVVDASWALVARDGVVARFGKEPKALRTWLRKVRRAFPDQSALGVTVGEAATYAELVAALQAARSTEEGAPLLPALGLLPRPPLVSGNLEPRIARRASVAVQVVAEGLRGEQLNIGAAESRLLEQHTRACFLTAVDRGAHLPCTCAVELGLRGTRHHTGKQQEPTCRDAQLRECVRMALDSARKLLPEEQVRQGLLLHVRGATGP